MAEQIAVELMRVDVPAAWPSGLVIGDVVRAFFPSPAMFNSPDIGARSLSYVMIDNAPDGTLALLSPRLSRTWTEGVDPPGTEYQRLTRLYLENWPPGIFDDVTTSPYIAADDWIAFGLLDAFKKDDVRVLDINTLMAEPV